MPASALTGLLGMLARESEDEAEAMWPPGTGAPPSYLVDQYGRLVVDPNSPEQRAARVLQLLAGEWDEGALDDSEDWSENTWSEFDDAEDIDAWVDAWVDAEEERL